jgi:hypothetical protein
MTIILWRYCSRAFTAAGDTGALRYEGVPGSVVPLVPTRLNVVREGKGERQYVVEPIQRKEEAAPYSKRLCRRKKPKSGLRENRGGKRERAEQVYKGEDM